MLELPEHVDLKVSVSAADLSSAEVHGLAFDVGHVVVTPLERLDSGVGVYSSESTFLVKELLADGISASFLDPPERRTFEVRKSAVANLVTLSVSISGSLTTNFVWFYIERLLSRSQHSEGRSSDAELEVTVIDPLAPPESNRLVLRGKPDVVLRSAAEISRRALPPPAQPANDSQAGP